MEITILHGVKHKGSTYNISKQITEHLSDENTVVNEFFAQNDMPHFCIGCMNCVLKGEDKCPHYENVSKIVSAMERADIIIVDSPTYVMEMTGQLKALFDHFAYMYIVHRPNMTMFNKIGIVVSTAAGAGTGRVNKSLANQLYYLGVPKVIKYGKNVRASGYHQVTDKIKDEIANETEIVAKKALKSIGKSRPKLFYLFMFNLMKKLRKNGKMDAKLDGEYWKENDLYETSPWGRKK